MKRSVNVTLTAIMLTTSVTLAGCDGVDDRTAYNKPPASNVFNYEQEKKMRLSCDKPEDFSMSECHNRQAQSQQQRSHGSAFVMYPFYMHSPYYSGHYGPSTSTARSYSNARSAVGARGLAGSYRASTVTPVATARFGSIGNAMATRATVATVTRGGFGTTGRGFVASAAHGSSVSVGA